MKSAKLRPRSTAETARQVKTFIGKFTRKHQVIIRAVRRFLRSRLPGAYELVYDNYNFFVIAFGTTEQPKDSVLSLAADANGVTVFFLHGASLPDPHKILLGSGKRVRCIRGKPLPQGGAKVIIRLISPKQRPRRK